MSSRGGPQAEALDMAERAGNHQTVETTASDHQPPEFSDLTVEMLPRQHEWQSRFP